MGNNILYSEEEKDIMTKIKDNFNNVMNELEESQPGLASDLRGFITTLCILLNRSLSLDDYERSLEVMEKMINHLNDILQMLKEQAPSEICS